MDTPKYVKKKLVTVRCNNPFRYGKIPFAGICNRVVLEVEAINYALMHKAFVVEHLKGGKEISLGFDNYNTYNGPTEIDDNTQLFDFKDPEIEVIDGFGNRKKINKPDETQESKPIIHINLDEEKKKEEEKERQKREAELQRKKQEELERKEAEIKARIERDKKAKEEAANKIIAQAQAKANKTIAAKDIKVEEKKEVSAYSFDLPSSITSESPKIDNINDQSDLKKNDKKDNRKK